MRRMLLPSDYVSALMSFGPNNQTSSGNYILLFASGMTNRCFQTATLTLSATKQRRRYVKRIVGATPRREAIDRARLFVLIIGRGSRAGSFPRCFRRVSCRFLPQSQSIANSPERNRRRFGDRTGFSRSLNDRLSAIADNGHVSRGVSSVFLLLPRSRTEKDGGISRVGAAAWRFVHFLPRENHLSVGVRLRNHSSKSVRVASPSRVAVRCDGVNALIRIHTENDSAAGQRCPRLLPVIEASNWYRERSRHARLDNYDA